MIDGYEHGILRLLRNGDWMAEGAEGASEQRSGNGGLSPAALRRLVLALPTFSSLRLLHLFLSYPCGSTVHSADIDTLPFAGLPALEALVLDGCGEVDLRGLPPSLRTLRVFAETYFVEEDLPGGSLAIPQGCRCGGTCKRAVWRCCHAAAECALLGKRVQWERAAWQHAAAPHCGCCPDCCRLTSAAVQGYAKRMVEVQVGWTT